MTSGYTSCVIALLENLEYTIDHMAQNEVDGDTAVHTALSHGMLKCARLLLFSTHFQSGELLHQLERRICLLLWFDAPMCPMVHPCRRETCTWESLDLLEDIVDNQLKEVNDLQPLLKKSKFGKSAMAVAARCGCYHEVKCMVTFKYKSRTG
jgi:hypothetical protein